MTGRMRLTLNLLIKPLQYRQPDCSASPAAHRNLLLRRRLDRNRRVSARGRVLVEQQVMADCCLLRLGNAIPRLWARIPV
jgi:hypothetical protein